MVIEDTNISVVIPTYNYGRFVAEAIHSVLGQTVNCLEIIVVDDGSTDETEAVVGSFGDRVRFIKQQNSGVGVARNRGVAESTGEYIAFLDADDYWHPQKLEKQLEVFEADKEIGLVHCGITNVDTSGVAMDDMVDGRFGWVASDLLRFQPVIIGPGSTSLIKREVFKHIGGYDTDPDLHPSEDWEFSYRVACVAKFGFVREPLVYYRHHGKGGHTNIARMERAMTKGFKKSFATDDEEILDLKSEAYARLYTVLAGSYFQAGQYGGFVRNAVKSILKRPANIRYFVEYPMRKLKRR